MTDQERDLLRVAAWDGYLASKANLVACCTHLQRFREPFRVPVVKLLDDVLSLTEQEVLAVPDRSLFLAAYQDFRNALTAYEDAIDQARKFNWPVPVTDEAVSLCRRRPRGRS
jgi:hypothetical protein